MAGSSRPSISFLNQPVKLRIADFDERELGRDKKAVEQYKEDDQGKLEDKHAWVYRRFRSDCRRHSEALYPLRTLAAITVPCTWRFLFWPLLDLRALERR
jgi:hypothetical protein